MNTIHDEWEQYRSKVIPTDTNPIQLAEMKRVFYAGVYSMMALNMRLADMPVSEEAVMHMMAGLQVEVETYFSDYFKAMGVNL